MPETPKGLLSLPYLTAPYRAALTVARLCAGSSPWTLASGPVGRSALVTRLLALAGAGNHRARSRNDVEYYKVVVKHNRERFLQKEISG